MTGINDKISFYLLLSFATFCRFRLYDASQGVQREMGNQRNLQIVYTKGLLEGGGLKMWDVILAAFDSIAFHCMIGFIIGLLLMVLGFVYRKRIPTALFVTLLLAGILLILYGGIWLMWAIAMTNAF